MVSLSKSDAVCPVGYEYDVPQNAPLAARIKDVLFMSGPGLVIAIVSFAALVACGPETDDNDTPHVAKEATSASTDSSGNAEWSVPRDEWPNSAGVPECEHEDGSTQKVCWHYDNANGTFVNMSYGEYTYATRTDEMHNWSDNE